MANAVERSPRGVALVTGASRGVGRATAVALSRAGYDLVLSGRDEEALQETVRQLAANSTSPRVVVGDIRTQNTRDQILAAGASGLKAMVHCASARPDPATQATLVSTPSEDLDELVDSTVKASTQLLRGLIPVLAKGSPSHLVIISSDWSLRGSHGPPVFSAAKAAIAQLIRTSRKHLAELGISATILCPGDIASYDRDWQTAKWNLDDPTSAIRSELGESRIPLSDITDTVLFCLSRSMCRVEEMILAPLDPNYDY